MFPSEDYSRSNAQARAQEGRQRYHRQKAEEKKEKEARIHREFPPEQWEWEMAQESAWMLMKDEDKAWVHWEYTLEEWALFEKVDWVQIRLVFWGSISGLLASAIVAILRGSRLPDPPLLLAVLGWCVCCLSGGLSFDPYTKARKRHKARLQEPRTVTFSRQGVWEAGTFFPINESMTHLTNVTLTFDPPVLHFRLLEGRSSVTFALRVPVPRGQEEEAGFLLERFQTEVIQARAQLVKEWKSPPEPR